MHAHAHTHTHTPWQAGDDGAAQQHPPAPAAAKNSDAAPALSPARRRRRRRRCVPPLPNWDPEPGPAAAHSAAAVTCRDRSRAGHRPVTGRGVPNPRRIRRPTDGSPVGTTSTGGPGRCLFDKGRPLGPMRSRPPPETCRNVPYCLYSAVTDCPRCPGKLHYYV